MTDPSAALDRRVLDTLKEVHNRGADLYNAGEHRTALHLYLGALLVARAFLDHRPAVRRIVDDGLAEVEAAEMAAKPKAFRLHEVIDQVRAALKDIWRGSRAPLAARLSGVVTSGGRPVPHATVLLTARGGALVAAVPAGADGAFSISAPPGDYAVAASVPGGSAAAAPVPVKLTTAGETVKVEFA